MDRELSGIYFRIYDESSNKFLNKCFEDCTAEQQNKILDEKESENTDILWYKNMILLLAETLKSVGNNFDIIRNGV